jgi:hypothetical protein
MGWELHDGQAKIGPLDEAHVLRMINQGLPATTMVRGEDEQAFRPIGSHPPFAAGFRALAATQAALLASAPAPVQQARRISKLNNFGAGCFVQGIGGVACLAVLGLGAPAIGAVPAGLFALLVLLGALVLGRRYSTSWSCGACGNPVAGVEVRVCPTCKATLS